MKFLFSVCLSLGIGWSLWAQQLPKVYNQFFMNPYIYNPAYAGVEGHSVLFFMYKNQWGNIDGAPTYMHANFHLPLKGGIAFGGMVENQSEGIVNRSSGKISGGYLVTLDREHFLRFGLSLGAGNQTLNFNEFDSPNDPAFANYAENTSFMIGDFGATYHFGHFNVGFSLPQLFGYDIITENSFSPTRVTALDNILFKMNYRGHINDDIAIEPHLIYRYSNILPDQIEATVILHVFHIVWVGGSYRQDAGAVGLLGIKLKEKIGIGYSYETGNPKIAGSLGGSHELHIGYHLGSKKEHATHVSSFIKSHRKSAEQRAQEAELERQRNLQALQDSRQADEVDEDALTIAGTPSKVKTKEEPWSYEKEDNLVERTNSQGDRELGVKFDQINENGEKEIIFSWLPPPPEGVSSETYEIANINEAPKERTTADGTKEVGVKWIRTLDNGKAETLVVWNEVLTEQEAAQIDYSPSEKLVFSDTKIVISAPDVTPIDKIKTEFTETEDISTTEGYAENNNETTNSNVLGANSSTNNESNQVEQVTREETVGESPIEEQRTQYDPTKETNTGFVSSEKGDTETPSDVTSIAEDNYQNEGTGYESGLPEATQTVENQNTSTSDQESSSIVEESTSALNTKSSLDQRSHEELANSDQYLVVKRGNNLVELPAGNHLIAGAFESFQLAEDYSDVLFQRGFHDTRVGYVSERGYYYVVIFQSDNMDLMKRQKSKMKSLSGLSKIWILKVN